MDIKKLNISDDLLDENIYRIIPFDRFMEMLEYRINVFIKPHLWDDPFENLLTHPSLIKKTKIYENEKYYIYAQCWSFSGENNLLWRTYSQNSDSIRIKSTPRKLIDSICNTNKIFKIENSPDIIGYNGEEPIYEVIEGFIGRVKYLSFQEISDYLSKRAYNFDLNSYFETLLIKRKAFKNEEELRIGIRHFIGFDDVFLQLSTDELFKYDLSINNVIDEVAFNPRISDYKFTGLKKQIKTYGFQNLILKSDLYDLPKIDEILK